MRELKGKNIMLHGIMMEIKSKSNYVSVCKIRVDIDATVRGKKAHFFFPRLSICTYSAYSAPLSQVDCANFTHKIKDSKFFAFYTQYAYVIRNTNARYKNVFMARCEIQY